jgi:hypothetical protein
LPSGANLSTTPGFADCFCAQFDPYFALVKDPTPWAAKAASFNGRVSEKIASPPCSPFMPMSAIFSDTLLARYAFDVEKMP